MHKRRSPPGQAAGHKGHASESQCGIHKRSVSAQIFQVLFVRRRLHVARALVFAALRLLAEVDKDDGDQAQQGRHSERISPIAERLCGLWANYVTEKAVCKLIKLFVDVLRSTYPRPDPTGIAK